MNRILYCLIGCGVAGAIMAAFFQKQNLAKISSTDVALRCCSLRFLPVPHG